MIRKYTVCFINKINKLIIILLLCYSVNISCVLAFLDKMGREISLEWDTTLSQQDRAVSHKAYLSQKEYYEKNNIKFKKFFDDYNDAINNELKSEEELSIDSSHRTFHLYRAKHNDTTCGFAYFKKKDEEGACFYLELIALAPEYQHSGIGKHLVFGIKKKHQKLRRLSLDTREFNSNSQKFYDILGFVTEPTTREGYFHRVWESK